MLLVLTVLLCMSFLTQKGVSIYSALGFYLMFTVTIEMSRNSGPKNVFSIFFIVCTTMRWTPWLLQYRFWLLTFCTLAFLWVLKRGYVAHAKDGTDLRATLHSCEMWFRFKKKKSDNKTMFAARILKRHHYIGVLLYGKHCRSALKKCWWWRTREMKHWGSFTLSWCLSVSCKCFSLSSDLVTLLLHFFCVLRVAHSFRVWKVK